MLKEPTGILRAGTIGVPREASRTVETLELQEGKLRAVNGEAPDCNWDGSGPICRDTPAVSPPDVTTLVLKLRREALTRFARRKYLLMEIEQGLRYLKKL